MAHLAPVVLHVHCVALTARKDAKKSLHQANIVFIFVNICNTDIDIDNPTE